MFLAEKDCKENNNRHSNKNAYNKRKAIIVLLFLRMYLFFYVVTHGFFTLLLSEHLSRKLALKERRAPFGGWCSE